MRALPSVAVIIPNHRRIAELQAAVASVRAQTYAGRVHVFLVYQDHPGFASIRARLGNDVSAIPYEPESPRASIAAQRNAGLEASSEDLVAFLDDDDLWHPGKLDIQVRALTSFSGAVACGTEVVKFTEDHDLVWPSATPEPRLLTRYEVRRSGRLMTSSLLVAGEVARSLRLSERVDWLGLDDYDFKLRLSEQGSIVYLPQVLTALRVEGASTSRSKRAAHYARAFDVLTTWMKEGHRTRADRRAFWTRLVATAVLAAPTDDAEAFALIDRSLDGSVLGRWDRRLAAVVKRMWHSRRVVPALRRVIPRRYVE